ncbi:glutathione S-transferase family protein [Rhodovarius crocodyli]|uniref:Glutathione S-transferase family protein n=1 Tax=Rhodovarius crocodyli TaxID=1979269 RepID=A0A437MGI5_9PROT|nr:glutathione S-transferase family protein [Rhodovarius crocodyli]RVT96715.1 glutathione S-transferase family protein [Rhodovarius crocodyli]
MSLTIYGVLRSRASRPVWLAHELGLDFQHVPVIQSYRLADAAAADAPLNTASPSFLAVNPNGMVPSMKDGDFVLHESLAICLYLARKAGGELAARDAQEEALMTQWALWAATEVEPRSLSILRGVEAEANAAALRRPFAVLEKALKAGGGFVLGGRFTVADIMVAEIVRYAAANKALFAEFPAISAWLATAQARPAHQRMAADRAKEPA